jgi:hypothetical protein
MEENLDMVNLRTIVIDVFEADVLMKGGSRNLVNSRKVFAKILTGRGYSLSAIARYLDKDHTTIIHYIKDVDGLLKYTPNVLNKYLMVRDKFNKVEGDLFMTVRERELQSSIDSLNSEVERLILENNNYKWNRLNTVFNLIDKRTPVGKEELIYKRINQLFNSEIKDE